MNDLSEYHETWYIQRVPKVHFHSMVIPLWSIYQDLKKKKNLKCHVLNFLISSFFSHSCTLSMRPFEALRINPTSIHLWKQSILPSPVFALIWGTACVRNKRSKTLCGAKWCEESATMPKLCGAKQHFVAQSCVDNSRGCDKREQISKCKLTKRHFKLVI